MNPWAIKREPKKSLDKFLNTIGKHENDPEKIFEFLKTENSRKLMETQHKITTYRVRVLPLSFKLFQSDYFKIHNFYSSQKQNI